MILNIYMGKISLLNKIMDSSKTGISIVFERESIRVLGSSCKNTDCGHSDRLLSLSPVTLCTVTSHSPGSDLRGGHWINPTFTTPPVSNLSYFHPVYKDPLITGWVSCMYLIWNKSVTEVYMTGLLFVP